MKLKRLKITRHFCAILIAIGILGAYSISAQKTGDYVGSPVTKTRLIGALRSKSLQTREIVKVITESGVNFQPTPEVEAELIGAGARPEVIAAVRAHYRAEAAPAKNKGNGGGGGDVRAKSKFSGNPLGKDAVVALLQNGVPDAQVRKNIENRGVNFQITPEIKTEIRQAGGSVALVNLIAASFDNPNQNSVSNNVSDTGDASSRYEDLINQAIDQYDNQKNPPAATASLQQAVKLEPNQARAYQLLGFMTLYGVRDYTAAETHMREAVNRGGSAVFRVFHDHDGIFTDTCEGSLYIAKDTVRFEGDDNRHTFQTADSEIKQIKTNSAWRRALQTKSGSFKIVLKSGEEKDGIKYSFAPLTDNIAESKMIIRLIGKNE